MRRLYVLPKSVFTGQIQIGTQVEAGAGEDENGKKATAVMLDVVNLFHPMIGSHYIDLPDGMILMCTSFDHSEIAEDLFHGHPEVAILPHPTLMGNVTLKEHVGSHAHRFQPHHLSRSQTKPFFCRNFHKIFPLDVQFITKRNIPVTCICIFRIIFTLHHFLSTDYWSFTSCFCHRTLTISHCTHD